MISSSTRQAILLLFIPLEISIGTLLLNMSMFENLIIISLGALVMKLTDIEEAIRWSKN